jgi:hypothetical protein
MADFDDNPFADPNNINPFNDSSVTGASNPPVIEEYNPFAEEDTSKEPEPPKLPPPPSKPADKKKQKKEKEVKTKTTGRTSGRFQPPVIAAAPPPAVLHPEPPPAYTPAPADFQREQELKQREEELAKRESQLQEKEKNLSTLGTEARPRNFPPLPKFCPCQPCFYINIGEEIPPSERWKMRLLIALLFFYAFLLFINLILTIPGVVVAADPNNNNTSFNTTSAIVAIVVGIILLFLLPMLSLFCWFMPAYYAYRKDSSLAFMWFFFIMVIQCVAWLVIALGPPGFSVGIISGVAVISLSPPVGGLWLALAFLWLLLIPWGAVMIFLVHRYYRASGMTLDKAAAEAAQGAASNKYIRDAAKGAVRAGVSAATTAATQD